MPRGTAVAGLLLLVALVYGPSLRNGFVHDDTMFIQDDPRVKSLSRASELFVQPRWGFDERARKNIHLYYRPLEALPYAISAIGFGSAAWPAHLLIVLLHAVNAVLFFFLARSLLAAGSDRDPDVPAGIAAAIFAVHPGHSESVLWVAAIGGVGAVTCTFLALMLHRKHAERWSTALPVGLLFFVALLFKESGIVLPLVLLAYDLLLAADRGVARLRRVWRVYAAMLPFFAAYTALRTKALGDVLPGRELQPFTPGEQVVNAVAEIPRYFRLFVAPLRLSFFHDFEPVPGPSDPSFLTGAALITLAAIAFLMAIRRRPLVSFAIALTFLAIGPHLLMRLPGSTLFGERYLYLPSAGLLLLTATLLASLRPGRGWVVAGAMAVVALLGARSFARSLDYRDEVTLFTKTLQDGGEKGPIRTGLVVALIRARRFGDALPHARDVVHRFPRQNEAWHNLGLVLQQTGDVRGAMDAYRRAISIDPADDRSLLNLGFLLDRAGAREESVELQIRAVEVNPANADAWWNLASVASEEREWSNARRAAARVAQLRPGDPEAKRLLLILERRTASDGIDPQTAERAEAARRRFAARDVARAVSMLKAAAWLDDDAALPHHYLANIHYSVRRPGLALAHERQALVRDPGNELYRRNVAALGGR